MEENAPEPANKITEGVIWKQLLLFFFPILFGTFFQQLYNAADAMIVGRFVGKEALSAVGDSKRPLYFLIASCLTNIVLDVVFVVGFQMGVAGAALATILSQALSAALVSRVLVRTEDMHQLEIRKVRIDGRMLRRIVQIGFPAGLQSVMYSSSNLIIQTGVNSLGTDTVAAWTAYGKIDSMFWMIMFSYPLTWVVTSVLFLGYYLGFSKLKKR